jgi:hypothetical protein
MHTIDMAYLELYRHKKFHKDWNMRSSNIKGLPLKSEML